MIFSPRLRFREAAARLGLSLALALGGYAASLLDVNPPVARAAIIVANDPADSPGGDCSLIGQSQNHCTLRAAITLANGNSGSLISLQPVTYTLTQTQSITFTAPVNVFSLSGLATLDRSQSPTNFLVAAAGVNLSGFILTNSKTAPALTVAAGASLKLDGVQILANLGQGLMVNGGAVSLQNSVIANNNSGGLNLVAGATAAITNTTVSGNSTSSGTDAGGIAVVSGTLSLANVTLANNTGNAVGGLSLTAGAIDIQNSVVAGNTAVGGANDCSVSGGTFNSGGHNLLQDSAGGCAFNSPTDIVSAIPGLAPLLDYGGNTLTHALLAGSPALDHGNPATCAPQDQRGVARQGAACDIGAFELPLVSFSAAAYSVNETAGAATITATLAASVPFTLTAQFSTSDLTAVAPADYTAVTNGLLTFAPGSLSATAAISVVNHPLYMGDKKLNLALAAPSGVGLLAPATAQLTIRDAQPPPQVQLDNAAYSINKAAGSIVLTTTLSTVSGVTATVDYATADLTGRANIDYTPVSGTLVFTPSVISQTVLIPIANDGYYHGDKTFSLTLSKPHAAGLGAPSAATVTLIDTNPRRVWLPALFSPFAEHEPNNSPGQANGPFPSGYILTGQHNGGTAADPDYYAFTTTQFGAIDVQVAGLVDTVAQVQLFHYVNSTKVRDGFAGGATPGTGLYEIHVTTDSGPYYVLVFTPANYTGGPYQLSITYP